MGLLRGASRWRRPDHLRRPMGQCHLRRAGAVMRLDDLRGRWSVERVIEDHRADLTGRFEGEAIWSPDANGLVQTEVGVLHYGSASPMQATRRYLWRAQGEGIAVFFDDARPFHIVPAPGQEALHDCPPDTYRVRYAFTGLDAFTTVWHVTGPRKHMTLTTRFTCKPA
ncbi:hypothetical protein Jann_2662 [Jannaschia sp. CCS1]|nr:hypothetical protein Jann_2662 [Jannaschia sp. CCS1]